MEIAGIAVDPAARGQGVGSHMIRQAVRRYRPRHVCAETDDDAVGFYRKNGFSVIGFDLYAYSNRDPERHEVRVEMGKRLDQAGISG